MYNLSYAVKGIQKTVIHSVIQSKTYCNIHIVRNLFISTQLSRKRIVKKLLDQSEYKAKARAFLQNLMKSMSSELKQTPEANNQTHVAVSNNKPLDSYLNDQPDQTNEVAAAVAHKKYQNKNQKRKNTSKNSTVQPAEETQKHNDKHKEQNQGKRERNRNHRVKRIPAKSNESSESNCTNLPEYLLSAKPNNSKSKNGKHKQRVDKVDYDYEDESNEHIQADNVSNIKPRKQHQKLPQINFKPYMQFEECSEGLKLKELLQGTLRINARNFNEGFINSEDGGRDIYISGVESRNRALPGDIIVVKLLPKSQWKLTLRNNEVDNSLDIAQLDESLLTRTAEVVFILEKKHPRVAAGHLNPYRNNAFGFALMSPTDNRLPRLMIPLTECPADFKTRPKDFEKTLFIAHISNWNLNMAFASGKLMRSLGEAGHIEPETEAILLNNDIDSSAFGKEVIDCLPDGENWFVSKDELSKRKDLRKECIFTIDPATARDLDDALSCKKIGDDLYEVGVHIADVSHFIDQDNALDKVARKRATSVYLAQRVIPMLPSVLCEKLCSLNPGVERLAYSVIWNLKSDGTITSEWFGRTVIRSCVKLSYNHAQQLIESDPTKSLMQEEYPEVYGDFALETIRDKTKMLFGVSKHLRSRRFESGALKLDQPKLGFTLDDEKGLPNGFSVYEYKDSNRMIEEFMLLANMAVGRKIYKGHPDRAILRCHPPPHQTMMDDVMKICAQNDIPFDITDSASISRSLEKLSELDPEIQKTITPALVLLCTKPFQNAKYFCTGHIESETAYRHYALNVPIYTHFTSPIRRYPDVLVHRTLTATLDKSFKVNDDVKDLQAIAEHCNDKKWAAKKASEQSSLLFFAVYLMECGPIIEKGVVVGVLDKAVDVLCTRLGIVTRVYCDKLALYKHEFKMADLKPHLTLYWEDDTNKTVDEKINALTQRFERNWAKQKKENNFVEEEDSKTIPNGAIEQTFTMFSPVEIVLSVDQKTPTKIIGLLKSPFTTDTPESGI